MQLICVSRGTFGGGKELAEKLASKLGIPCLGREEAVDEATRSGIPVGKLEMAVMRPRAWTEHLASERDRYKAFITATLAQKALHGGVIYHGRTGHLVLPSVGHVLRLRVIMDAESRIRLTMNRLGLGRGKAREYNEQVDEDRRRWAKTLYNIDWDDPAHYDMVVNLDHVSVDNAAQALVAMAQLPDFQPTPASRRTLENLLLASRCRLAIGADPRTRLADVRVRADEGHVSVTYPPRHQSVAEFIPEVLSSVEGAGTVQCTMASTSILWIEERHEPSSAALPHLLEIAAKWNAAVGLVRLAPGKPEPDRPVVPEAGLGNRVEDAGILEDQAEPAAPDDPKMAATLSRLLQEGRAGGRWTVHGGARELVNSLDRTANCSLVVVGGLFLDKGESVRKRMTRELGSYVSETLHVPVIAADELEEQYLFGPRHWIRLLLLGAAVTATVALLFRYQEIVLGFLTRSGTTHRILAVATIAAFVPAFTWMYGTVSQYLLRLLRFE